MITSDLKNFANIVSSVLQKNHRLSMLIKTRLHIQVVSYKFRFYLVMVSREID